MKTIKLYSKRSEDITKLVDIVNQFATVHNVIDCNIFKDFKSDVRGTNTVGYVAVIKCVTDI